ncbi:LysR family transcriptional regulator [Paraburkholderia sediminicola]|uniref:LysR family transcriptional regulator n=1 Tax=Paraburkholderia sediminicola TaxID=458836 RepID=UPI0038BAACB7
MTICVRGDPGFSNRLLAPKRAIQCNDNPARRLITIARGIPLDLIHCMRVFSVLADTGSFTRSAGQLGVSTPHASRAIAQLESHLGTRLLHRTTRSIALTEPGLRYLARVHEILSVLDASEREVRFASAEPRGTLRMHCSASLADHFVLPLAAGFQRQYPHVNFDLTVASQMPDLVRARYDIALMAANHLPESNLVALKVGAIRSVLCASADYVEEYGVPYTLVDLATHRCLQIGGPAFREREWQMRCGRETATVPIDPQLIVDAGRSLAIAIRQGMGVGPLPSYIASQEIQLGDVIAVLPEYTVNETDLYLLYASRQYLDTKIRAWIDFMKAHMRSGSPGDFDVSL